MSNYTGNVRLECGNELHFEIAPPAKNTEVWCRRCQKMCKVAERYNSPAYRIKCKTCRYAKKCGTARLGAEMAIIRHRNKNGRHHRMVLMDHTHKVLWETGGDDPNQLELPFENVPRSEIEMIAERTRETGVDPPPF